MSGQRIPPLAQADKPIGERYWRTLAATTSYPAMVLDVLVVIGAFVVGPWVVVVWLAFVLAMLGLDLKARGCEAPRPLEGT